MPRCASSLAAIASWTDSAALAGSPVPPSERQVARENLYLPRYLPEAETAVGLPLYSHCAMRASVPEPLVVRVTGAFVLTREAEMPRLPRVAGPAMPSTVRPWLRW